MQNNVLPYVFFTIFEFKKIRVYMYYVCIDKHPKCNIYMYRDACAFVSMALVKLLFLY